MSYEAGWVIKGYELGDLLGQGGFGAVYLFCPLKPTTFRGGIEGTFSLL